MVALAAEVPVTTLFVMLVIAGPTNSVGLLAAAGPASIVPTMVALPIGTPSTLILPSPPCPPSTMF